MWTEHFWMGGIWIFPFIMIIIMLLVIFLVFGRRGFMPPWNHDYRNYYNNEQKETSFDILKKRYANGEISKEEFENIKRDIL